MANKLGGKSDHISIAFTDSTYATPYTDHTIPGSTPGHRVRHLGRQHEPVDILHNHLSHALIAHGGGGDSGGDGSGSLNADHPTPPGGNYILHSKNGGKRHYDELSGRASESPWRPSRRPVVPSWEAAEDAGQHRLAPHRRGRGTFNTMDCFVHPDAEEAQRQREQQEERRHKRGGKARVDGPLDHTLAELGMMQHERHVAAAPRSRPCRTSSPALAAPAGEQDGVRSSSTMADAVEQRSRSSSKAADDVRPSRTGNDRAVNSAYLGDSLLASTGYGVPPARGTAAEADAVTEYHRDQRMRCALDLRKETASGKATRAVDVQSVRELPNW